MLLIFFDSAKLIKEEHKDLKLIRKEVSNLQDLEKKQLFFC